jgi:hypothetical protein
MGHVDSRGAFCLDTLEKCVLQSYFVLYLVTILEDVFTRRMISVCGEENII